MLVQVDRATIQRRGKFSWLKKSPFFSISITSQSGSSVTVDIHRPKGSIIGLVYYVKEADRDSTAIVIAISEEIIKIPLMWKEHKVEMAFKSKKHKGRIHIKLVNKKYFELYEMQGMKKMSEEKNEDIPMIDITSLSSFKAIENSMITRVMYDGFSYQIDPRTFETFGYSPILENNIIMSAHQYTKSLFENDPQKNTKEDDAFIKKVRFLRSSPKMFISIFFHVSLEVARNSIMYSLYRLYTNPYYRKDLYKKITVKFIGELGEDHGALRKEFFELAGNEIVCDRRFILENGLFDFRPTSEIEPIRENSQSILNVSDGDFYSFVGFFLGHVIFQQVQINVRFSKTFYMAILNRKCGYEDIPSEQAKNSINWIRNNSVEGFSFVLKSGEPVTDENKEDFIAEYIYEETYLKKPGYQKMYQSFHKIVTDDIFAFEAHELERLISGVRVIPLSYLKKITTYKSCNVNTPEVVYFWKIMDKSSEEFRREILRFITGSSSIQYIPGSQAESILIEHVASAGALPTAHTCFRRLVLYKYTSLQEEQQKLELAIKENGGFQFI